LTFVLLGIKVIILSMESWTSMDLAFGRGLKALKFN